MAAEPIVIYSNKIDPAGVLRLLRQIAPSCRVEGPDDNWKTVTIEAPRGFLRKPSRLTFTHDRAYYTGDDWSTQMRGMMGYFSRFPDHPNKGPVLHLINSFRFALTMFPVPEPELEITSDDPRLKYVFAVVKHLDGAIFTPSALRDAAGRVLYGALKPDPSAKMPAILREVPATPVAERTRAEGGTQPDENDAPPPSPERVARRACAMAALGGRALLEQEDPADPGVEQTRQRIGRWVQEGPFRDELEPHELLLIDAPLGAAAQQAVVNATWSLEGLAVVAWALHRFELPPHDSISDPGKLLPSVGILNPARSAELIQNPSLRARKELETMRERLFAIHWRVTNFRLKPEAMDFNSFAKTAWFGPLDISGLPLAQNDLAIAGKPIVEVTPDQLGMTLSIAMERHRAINWLCGGSEVYTETDIST